jgi:hypothetical protein
MIYGGFVRELLGYDATDHTPSAVPLVKPSWGVAQTGGSALVRGDNQDERARQSG